MNKDECLYYYNKAAVYIELKMYHEAFYTVNEALNVYDFGT